MKKLLTLTLQFFAISLIAQTPQLINYQGIARDANGVAIKNKVIGLKFDFRQGGTTSPIIFSETQTVTTGNLGLFSTQIGKINTTGISAINWQAGTMFLELGIDTTGGASYIGLGTQQLISVPYAMHAQSVPSTFTNNVLTIGSGAGATTYTLTSAGSSPNTTVTSTGGGATVTSSGTNTFNIDVPATTFSAGPNISIQGTHPNYTISATSTVVAASASLVSTGAATTATLAPNSYSINVPVPTFTNTGQNIITGAYPNFTVNTPTVPAGSNATIVASGAAVNTTIAPNSYSINVPVPTFTNTGQNIIVGAYPNFTVNTPTVPAGSSATLVASGAAVNTTIAPNSYSINVPQTSVAVTSTANTLAVTNVGTNTISINVPTVGVAQGTGGISVTGSYPNYTISGTSNTSTLTLLTANTLSISNGNSVTIAPTLGINGNTLSVGPSTNTIALQNPTVTGTGAAVVTPSTGINFTVNVPPVNVAITSSASTMSVTNVGSNSVSINVPTVSISNGSNVVVGGSYPNYIINSTPTLSLLTANTLSISSGNSVAIAPTVSLGGFTGGNLSVGLLTNSVNIAPVLSGSGAVSVSGTFPNYTIYATPAGSVTSQTSSVTGTGLANISSTTTNVYNVDVPVPVLSTSGNSITITQGTLVTTATLAATPNTSVTVTSTVGSIGVTGAGTNSFNINIPTPSYNFANGDLTTGTVVSNISPSLGLTGNVLSVGASTNNITLPTAVQSSVTVTSTVGSIGITSAGTNSFNINIPTPSYNFANGNLTTGTVVSNISPSLGLTGNVLSVGASTNNITLPTAVQSSVTVTSTVGSIGITSAGTNSFNINIPTPSYNFANGNLTTGTVVSNISPSLGLTGNVLSVGASTNNITLPTAVQSSVTVTSTVGSIGITSAGTNSFNINIPTPSYNFANGNLTTGTVVSNISPSLGLTGNVLSVGASTNNIILPSAPQTSLVSTGQIGAITPAGTNSFNISIPAPSYNFANGNLTTGTVVSNISPSLGLTGNVLSVGASTNNITLPVAVQSSVTITSTVGSIGITSPGTNSFNINIPTPSYNFANGNLTTGTVVSNISPSLGLTGNVLSVGASTNNITLPVAVQSSVTITSTVGSIGITSPGTNSFNINIPTPSYNFANGNLTTGTVVSNISPSLGLTGNVLSVGASTNNITLPSAIQSSVTVTSTVGSIGITSAGTNSFNINIPTPSYNFANGDLTTGTVVSNISPSLGLTGNVLSVGASTNNITLPSAPQASLVSTGQIGAITPAGTNSFNISIPAPSYNFANGNLTTGTVVSNISPSLGLTGNVLSVGASTNNITLPSAPQASLVSTGQIGAITPAGTNSFNISIPAPSYNFANGNLTTGTVVSNISPSLGLTGNVLSVGASTNNITLPSAPQASLVSTGQIGAITPAGTNSFNISIPAPSYNFANGNLTTGTVVSNISPSLGLTGNVLSVGASTNNITLPSAAQASLVSTGQIGVITPVGTNSFNISIPAPSYNFANGNLTTGTVVSNISPSLGLTGNVLSVGASTNNITLPSAPQASLVSTGQIGVITSAGTNSFNISIPAPTYNNATGVMTTGTVATTVAPTLLFAANILSSGPTTNSVNFASGTNALWSTLGNAATNTLTNFIGTTDNIALNFKVNNQKAGLIDHTGFNTFFGIQSGNVNTGANNNTGFGAFALAANTSGVLNTAVGHLALTANTTGSQNTGIGRQALAASNGPANTAVGFQALFGNTSGGNNTGLGNSAGLTNTTGSGNVFLGYQAGYYETGSNKLYISNSSTSVTPLIYGDFANNRVAVGTATPSENFQVQTSVGTAISIISPSTAASSLYFGHPALHPNGVIRYDNSSNLMDFWTNNTSRMQIDVNGYVAINAVPSSSYNLNVFRSASTAGDYGPGKYNIAGIRQGITGATNGGTSWTFGGVDAAVSGSSFWGNNFSAGVAGHNFNDFANSAGVLGAQYNAAYWGALAFNDGTATWGVYTPNKIYSTGARIVDGSQGADKVLTSDASGNTSWQNSSKNTGFMAKSNAAQTSLNAVTTIVNFGAEDFDDGSDFASNQYVCPTAGVYHFDASVSWNGFTGGSNWTHIMIFRNGNQEAIHMVPTSSGFFSANISANISCALGDIITIRVLQQSGATQTIYTTSDYTYFSGYRVY